MANETFLVVINDGVGEAECPPLGDTLNVLAADTDWVLVSADTLGEVERACDGYHWHVIYHPKAGKYIDLGGDEVYVDLSGYQVADAVAVLESLDVEIDDYAKLYGDDILGNMNRVF